MFFPGYVFRFLLCSQLSTVMLLWAVNANDHCPDSFDCGSLGSIRFPFTKAGREGCGALAIHGCDDHKPQFHFINISGKKFNVTKIDYVWFNAIHIIDEDLRKLLGSGRSCELFDRNITLPSLSHLGYFTIWSNITLFKCKRNLNVSAPKTYLNNTSCGYSIFFRPTPDSDDSDDVAPNSLAACSTVQLPTIFGRPISANIFESLTDEIALQFNPSAECDQCQGGLDHDGRPRGRCFLDSEENFHCAKRKDRHQARLLGLILGVGIGPWIILGLILLTLRHRKLKHGRAHVQLQSTIASAVSSSGDHTQTDRIFFGVPIFSYKELQEATNNFDCTRKLGEGGFGRVYYGKLVDGREVAVKHLFYHNYRRVEQFMNEITILTCLRHRNLVSLYGCTSRDSRELLLVYEYIPNGTVASHLRGDLSRAGFLTWPIRMQIAIETATALAYLHASDIIHRDVKTNNILLDINFSVKVADFGLSRLFPSDATHVSTAPQGSPGYLDPEYFQCYQLTAKSDVYSFGVVLIELISSLPAVDTTRERDEINLASLATKKIQQCALSELLDPSLGFESNQEVRSKLTAVAELAFQCVQVDKELRPSMDEVLNALKKIESGSLESEQLKKADENDGAVISQSEEFQPPSMASGDRSQVRFLMNKKLPSSPNSLTEKWESASTTPSASASA